MISISTSFLPQSSGDLLAYKHLNGDGPGIIFCPGFQSSMVGTKSKALFDWCESSSREFTCFDYYGHGESLSSQGFDGRKQTIGRWKNDLLNVIDMIPSSSEQILVGSSMGAWLMILAALERPDRISGLVGISAAPDFTTLLFHKIIENDHFSNQMKQFGYADIPTEYDADGFYRIFKELLEHDEEHLLLVEDSPCKLFRKLEIPIRLIHGTEDVDISWKYSQALYDSFTFRENKELILIQGGDHRLSTQRHISTIIHALEGLL